METNKKVALSIGGTFGLSGIALWVVTAVAEESIRYTTHAALDQITSVEPVPFEDLGVSIFGFRIGSLNTREIDVDAGGHQLSALDDFDPKTDVVELRTLTGIRWEMPAKSLEEGLPAIYGSDSLPLDYSVRLATTTVEGYLGPGEYLLYFGDSTDARDFVFEPISTVSLRSSLGIIDRDMTREFFVVQASRSGTVEWVFQSDRRALFRWTQTLDTWDEVPVSVAIGGRSLEASTSASEAVLLEPGRHALQIESGRLSGFPIAGEFMWSFDLGSSDEFWSVYLEEHEWLLSIGSVNYDVDFQPVSRVVGIVREGHRDSFQFSVMQGYLVMDGRSDRLREVFQGARVSRVRIRLVLEGDDVAMLDSAGKEIGRMTRR